MVKHHQIAPFLNRGTPDVPDWIRLKKSTAVTLAMNPVTEEFDYAADESPSTELKQYKPSLNQPLAMHENEPDYKLVFDMLFNMRTGEEAKKDFLLVFFQEKTADGGFRAWKTKSLVSCNSLDAYGSTIDFDILFGGEVKKGTVKIVNDQPVFTEDVGGEEFVPFTFTVKKGVTAVSAAMVTVDGTEKTTDATGKATFALKAGVKYLYGAVKGADSDYGTTGVVSTSNNELAVTFT